MRKTPIDIEIKSDKKYVSIVEKTIEYLMTDLAYFQDEISDVVTCVSEGVTNAIEWGNKRNPDKRVKIGILANKNTISMTITDRGAEHFDFTKYLKAFESLASDTCVQAIDSTYAKKGHCSLGIANMHRLMDTLTYRDILENGQKVGTELILEYRHKESDGERALKALRADTKSGQNPQ
jgi:anti-sigma regulatory factor (Ser/Thr protein kinase)